MAFTMTLTTCNKHKDAVVVHWLSQECPFCELAHDHEDQLAKFDALEDEKDKLKKQLSAETFDSTNLK